MSGRWMLAAALLVLAGGFWFYSRLIKKDAKGAENPFPARERWTGLGQLAASCLGLPLMISPFAAMQWGWGPALAAAVGGGILFGAAQNLAVSGCLTAQEGENRESAAEGRSISGWKRRAAAALVWLLAVLAAAAAGHTAAASFRGFVETESGELLRNSVGAAGAASCVILCVGAAGLGIVCRYRNVSRLVKAVAVCLVILDSAWLGKTYPIYLEETVWLVGIFLLAFFSGLIPAWVQTRPRGQILLVLAGIVLAAGCAGVLAGNPQPAVEAFEMPDSASAGLWAFLAVLLWGTVSGFDGAALAVSPLRYQKQSDFERAAVGAALLKSLCAVLGLLLSFALVRSDAAAMGLEEAPQFFAAAAADLLAGAGIPYDFTIALFLMAACSFLLAMLDTAVRTGTLAFREMTRRPGGKRAGGQAGWGTGAAATLIPAFAAAMLARHLAARVFAAASFAAVLLLLALCGISLCRRGKKGWILWIGAALLLAGAVLSCLLPAM